MSFYKRWPLIATCLGWVWTLLACQSGPTNTSPFPSPSQRSAWAKMAQEFHAQAQFDSAQRYWERVSTVEGEIEAAYQQALQGQTAQALGRLFAVQAAPPHLHAKKWLYLGHTYGLIGQQQKAITYLGKARQAFGETAQPDSQLLGLNHFLLQDMAHLLSQPDLRDAHLDTCLQFWQSVLPDGHYHLAEAQLAVARRQMADVPVDTFAQLLHPARDIYLQQASPRRELGLAQIALLQGINLLNRYETPRAADTVRRALELLYTVHPQPAISLARVHQIMASVQSRQYEPDTALIHLQQAALLLQRFIPDSLPSYHRLDQYRTAWDVYFSQNAYHQSIEAAQAEIQERKRLLGGKLNAAQAQVYSRLGTSYNYLGNPGKARPFQEESLRIYEQLALSPSMNVAISHYYLASSYSSLEMLSEAEKEFKAFLEIAKEFFSKESLTITQTRALYAADLARQGKFEQARPHAEVAEAWVERARQSNNSDDKRSAAIIAGNLNQYYLKQGRFAQSLRMARIEIGLKKQIFGPRHPTLIPAYRDAIQRMVDLNPYDEVITTIDTFYHLCGYTYPMHQHPFPGLELPSVQLDVLAVLLVQAMIHRDLIYRDTLASALHIKRFTETIDEVYFLLQIMLEAKELQQEQANLVEDIWPVLGRNVAALIDLSQNQGHEDALALAFQLAEISKAIWLRQALSDPLSTVEEGLPSTLKDAREQNQQALQGIYERMMRLETGDEPSKDSLQGVLASQEVQLIQEQDSIAALIHDLSPEHADSATITALLSPQDIQRKLLKPGSLLLEFVWGEESISVLGLTRDSISGYTLPLDSSFQALFQRYRSLTQDSLGLLGGMIIRDRQLDSVKAVYCSTGYALYQELLAPALTHFPKTNHLIIIPDGPLSYLPFDALLTQEVHPKEALYRSLPYLIRKYTIQYEYAAGLLQRADQKLPGRGVLAMAPAFRPDKSVKKVAIRVEDSARFHRSFRELGITVSPLAYNIPEVEGIHAQIKGSMFTGDAASKTRFLQVAPQYRVLHLATHAFASEVDPDYSHLLFAPVDSSSYELLYAYELYGLDLGADLAVLSACQTGFGRLQRGEGIMSLSRAFKYAGCPNIVTSLWQAEDYSTQLLMKLFYGHLKTGMGKAEALRQAKLDFLDQSPGGTQHPFFWGNFVLIGDNEPVPFPGGMWKWILLGSLLILGGIAVWRWRKL